MEETVYWRGEEPPKDKIRQVIARVFDGIGNVQEQPTGWWVIALPDRTVGQTLTTARRWIETFRVMSDDLAPAGGQCVLTRSFDSELGHAVPCCDHPTNALALVLVARLRLLFNGLGTKPFATEDEDDDE